MPTFEIIRKASNPEKVKQFAIDLKKLGEDYNVSFFTHYADNLCELILNFDIGKIKKQLNKFPKLITNLDKIRDE